MPICRKRVSGLTLQLLTLFLTFGLSEYTVANSHMPATLTLTQTIINDSGGSATEDDFEVYINGVSGVWGISQSFDAGSFTLVMSALDGYQSSQWNGDCAADGSIDLEAGQVASCNIVSTDMTVDLVLDKSVSDQSPSIGDVITFSILVSNLGPDLATNVEIVDVVMKGLEYQQGTIHGAGNHLEDDPYVGGLKWVIDNLPVGVDVNLTFDAMILPP